jgi:serine/threonine protein kinase
MNKVDIGHAAACRIFVQLCLAIEFIHSKGYIHRDIKPENIFLDRDMNVLLGDFGWCCHVSDTTYRYQKAGTYEYMSPEALNGKLQGREVDIWALGVLLYELFHNQDRSQVALPKKFFLRFKRRPLSFLAMFLKKQKTS